MKNKLISSGYNNFLKEIKQRIRTAQYVSGYSADNLWRMRKFYLNYANKPKLAPLVQVLAWAHNIIIMKKCKNDLSREFYVRMAIKFGGIGHQGKGRIRATVNRYYIV